MITYKRYRESIVLLIASWFSLSDSKPIIDCDFKPMAHHYWSWINSSHIHNKTMLLRQWVTSLLSTLSHVLFKIHNFWRDISISLKVNWGLSPRGYSDVFLYKRRLRSLFWVQNFEFLIFGVFSIINIFWDMKILLIFSKGHHKIGLYLGVISMHFRVFSKGQGT